MNPPPLNIDPDFQPLLTAGFLTQALEHLLRLRAVRSVSGQGGGTFALTGRGAGCMAALERITVKLIQIEGDPSQTSRWLCCVSPLIRFT